MKKNQMSKLLFLLLSFSLILSCSKNKEELNQPVTEIQSLQNDLMLKSASLNASVTVLASNIAYPRGLKFGPDGYLYVATTGMGGTNSTEGQCAQVIPPVGPYLGGNTATILRISRSGTITTVADKLPSSVNAEGATLGVADIEFIGGTMYALLNAGCSHGNSDYPSSVIRFNRHTKNWTVVADLSEYLKKNPVAAPEEDDFEPDGTLYSMVDVHGDLYVIESNHGEMIKVTTKGKVSRVLDFSAHYGHIVPTAVNFHGSFFVGNLNPFPIIEGASNIYKVSPGGNVSIYSKGFTTVLGVAFDKQDRLYVLETSASGLGPTPNTGRVVRVNHDNSRDVIIDKLNFPTAMIFGPDGNLYISNTGFGPPTGQILKVVLKGNGYHDNDDHH